MKRTDHRRTQRDRISKHKGLRLVSDTGLIGKKNILAVPGDGIVVVSDEITAVDRVTLFQVVINASQDLVLTVIVGDTVRQFSARIGRNRDELQYVERGRIKRQW